MKHIFKTAFLMTGMVFLSNVSKAESIEHAIFVDCDHNKISKEGTENSLKIRFYDGDTELASTNDEFYQTSIVENSYNDPKKSDAISFSNEPKRSESYEKFLKNCRDSTRTLGAAIAVQPPRADTTNITHFTIETSGSDGFYIDRLFYFQINGALPFTKRQKFGKQNDLGWCLSKDLQDGKGSWKKYLDRGCYQKLTFYVSKHNGKKPGNVVGKNK